MTKYRTSALKRGRNQVHFLHIRGQRSVPFTNKKELSKAVTALRKDS
jgi:hypothetical protein